MIHVNVMNHIRNELERALITEVPEDDPARAGVVKLGPLDGDPDPDMARISIELYYNDPDQTIRGSGLGHTPEAWDDQIEELEIGGTITWKRRFTVKGRCLLEQTREDLPTAHEIAASVRARTERALLTMDFSEINSDEEYVARPIVSDALRSEMIQAGGPPDSYDFHIKIRFDVLTTERG